MMDFTLKTAAAVARAWLSRASNTDLHSWTTVYNVYVHVKRPLIDALHPDTGRVTQAVSVAFTPLQRSHLLASAMSEYACLGPVVGLLDPCDIPLVDTCSPLSCLHPCFKPDRKLTRCIAEYLVKVAGHTTDEASSVVEKIFTNTRERKGTIVLSANIFDLLTCSEVCSYTSCHRFEGEYCAGPQQYLYDDHTAVLYYYEKVKTREGVTVPYKLCRQLVHLTGDSAALMRVYGDPPNGWAELTRPLIDAAMDRMPMKAAFPRNNTVVNGYELAYGDGVQAELGIPHHFLLGTATCPECGGSGWVGPMTPESCEECDGTGRKRA